jgi:hypothetical protein
MRSRAEPQVSTGAMVGLALIVAACGAPGPSAVSSQLPAPTSEATPTRAFTVQIEDGLTAQWNPDAAAAAMIAQIHGNERLDGRVLAEPKILSVEAWAGADVPFNIGAGQMFGHDVVWVVRAEGTFVAFSCPVAAPCPGDTSGFVMFDDTGAHIGSGFPLPSPEPAPDCAGVALPLCLTAVAVSKEYGVIKPDDQVVAVHVQPTKVRMCDGIIEPKIDVSYTLQNPVVIFTITVGTLPDGRWAACTY